MKHYQLFFLMAVLTGTVLTGTVFADSFDEPVIITEFLTEQPSLTRVGRDLTVLAVVENPAETDVTVVPELVVPDGIINRTGALTATVIPSDRICSFRWTVTATKPIYTDLTIKINVAGKTQAIERVPVRFLPARAVTPSDIIPAPKRPKKTSPLLIGAHNCPLWNKDAGIRWDQLRKHPERTPALGFYAQESPEVADWETKWAVEHGVDFFIYCWYRAGQGGPVKTRLAEAIHDALYHSKYQKEIKFTIMWENQSKGQAGISDEKDLMTNLFPYWMENYFKKENYLKIDNKPVLFIYRPEFLILDLGSAEKVKAALDKLRDESKKAGFNGLLILGEYRGTNPKHLKQMKDLGLDYSFAYCQQLSNSPSPSEAIDRQMGILQTVQKFNSILPQLITVSQAWSGWYDEHSIWKLPPDDFEILLRRAKAFVEKMPKDQLGSQMLILDNWNEWSEGHYLLPYTEYGFGYLDAIARVFTDQNSDHEDLIPGDIAKGPYDTYYRKWREGLRAEANSPDGLNLWNFDYFSVVSTQWKSMMGVSNFAIEKDVLKFKTSTRDPAIRVLFSKAFRANRYSKVKIRMKVTGLTGEKNSSQLLWIQDKTEDWSERKSIHLPIINNGKFNDYIFEVKQSPAWTGRITGLRFDCCSQKNVDVEIDEIELVK